MKLKRTMFKKLVALLFAALLVATSLLTVGFSLAEVHHRCTGDQCPICLNLLSLRALLKEMALPLLLGIGAAMLFAPGQAMPSHGRHFANATPVALGVRMND